MKFHAESISASLHRFNTDKLSGLSTENAIKNQNKYGKNLLNKKRKKNLFHKIIDCLLEPMILILLISWVITVGINVGKFLKRGEADFVECIGIFLAILLSVIITLIMEGTSEKAFNALNKIYDNVQIKVIRNGKTILIKQEEVTIGDLVVLSSGDKIVADGRLIESIELAVDESTLTGESLPSRKNAEAILKEETHLADRVNMVYSGTFVTNGYGTMLVTGIGNDTEIGLIAGELDKGKDLPSPLQQKLTKLSKTITIIGIIASVIVFGLSLAGLILNGKINFESVQSIFIASIV